ncbi:hypothetical protein M4951_09125 [Blastopirellula sp. J2-11]|uniref:hypothetical protein n=1 Tax=Blastopirellula sp. J2-11 TaxID=2943192 RepID=UPI0021CAC2CE|nr:hypothetical protein [Blastopirellula sp. J2-11]UUO08464.1 hypothetical protein M4951_09125 [Blastopirellula sp. J2-11]
MRIWLALMLIIAGSATIAWIITRNVDHLYGGLFFTLVPLGGLLYSYFFLFNPWSDPLETQARLEKGGKNSSKMLERSRLLTAGCL